jgi:hypothetical protein
MDFDGKNAFIKNNEINILIIWYKKYKFDLLSLKVQLNHLLSKFP